jgi:hypothetical protein
VALLCGDAETVSGGTRQHQNASSEASSCYSHSIKEKWSVFAILLLVFPWLLPVIGCIPTAPSRENSYQTWPFRELSLREFLT